MLLFVLGCQPSPTPKPAVEDTGYAWRDTSAVVDTSDSAVDTGDSTDTRESGGDTADTGTVAWAALDVFPAAIAVHVGATWQLRVVATDSVGARGDLPNDTSTPTFTSDDPSVASIDAAGLVTSLAGGSTTLRAAAGGLEATSTVEVRTDGVVTVTVLNGLTGLPIEGVHVGLVSAGSLSTDASGVALLPVETAGPVTFSTWEGDTYNALTVADVVGRDVTLTILPKDTNERSAMLTGSIDFSGVTDGDFGELVVGFAAASIQGALAITDLEDLFSSSRTLVIAGLEADLPANLFVETVVEDYEATARAGPASAWGLAGPLPMAETLDNMAGTGDALELLADNLRAMNWGQRNGLVTAAESTTAADLSPSAWFDGVTALNLPVLPDGFLGDETWFVLTTEERVDEGFIVTGLGSGSPGNTIDVPTVPDGTVPESLGSAAFAHIQVGGLGSGGPAVSTIATPSADGALVFAEPPAIAEISAWDPASRVMTIAVDPSTDFVRIRLHDDVNRVHDILTPGSWSGTLPMCVPDFRLARAEIEVLSMATAEGSYEGWLHTGDLSIHDKPVLTAARTEE